VQSEQLEYFGYFHAFAPVACSSCCGTIEGACHGAPKPAIRVIDMLKTKDENIMLISGGYTKNYGACGNCLWRVNSSWGYRKGAGNMADVVIIYFYFME